VAVANSLAWVAVGKGATLELLLARAIGTRPISDERALACATVRRFYACGWPPKARTNLALVSRVGMSVEDLARMGSEQFDAEELAS
jgi:hypothetical protein